jgi:hypothetical protein
MFFATPFFATAYIEEKADIDKKTCETDRYPLKFLDCEKRSVLWELNHFGNVAYGSIAWAVE